MSRTPTWVPFLTPTFSGCHKLRQLVLSYNRLRTLPNLSTISDTLDSIQVEHNNLINVGSLQDLAFPTLRYIFLGLNEINHLDIRHLILPRLYELDISYNLLQGLDHPELLAVESLKENRVILNLVGNLWNCDRNLSWVVSASQKVNQHRNSIDLYWNQSPVLVINAEDMICYMPPRMRGKQAIRVGRYQPLCWFFREKNTHRHIHICISLHSRTMKACGNVSTKEDTNIYIAQTQHRGFW